MTTLTELKAKRDEIDKQIEEIEKTENQSFRTIGSEYFSLTENLLIKDNYDNEDNNNLRKYQIGNYYPTYTEAEHEARHREFEMKVAKRFRELNGGIVYPNKDEARWYIDTDFRPTKHVSSVISYSYAGHQRGWVGIAREVTQQVIEEFGPNNFIQWAKGEL